MIEIDTWPDLDDLRLLLEPYGIDSNQIAVDRGLEITFNPSRKPGEPAFALHVKTFDLDPTGSRFMRDGVVASTIKTIPLSMLPGLRPRL